MRITQQGTTGATSVRSSKRCSTYAIPIALLVLFGATSCDSPGVAQTAPVLLEAQLSDTASMGFEDGVTAYERGDYATALAVWKPLAEQGHAQAQFKLGLMYSDGEGVPQDYKAADKWYRLAAEQGHASAQTNLAITYAIGRGVPQDYKTAEKWFTLSAEQGDAGAQYNLGVMYRNGYGVPQDDNAAVKWFTLAAEQGHASAQTDLGLTYATGSGVPQDYKTAEKWFTLSAEQGDAGAQNNLGVMYRNGYGVPQDDNAAVKWYTLAAEQGDASAQTNLGVIYGNGEGVPEDDKTAVKWYTLAAEQGYVEAQNNLGMAYEYGSGVNKDLEEAVRWYRLAAEQGHEMAKTRLTDLQDDIDQLNRVQSIMTQAENGDPEAQNSLGDAYFWGENGFEKSYIRSANWHRKAAKQGNALSALSLAHAYRDGRGVDLDSSECFYWGLIAQSNFGRLYYSLKETAKKITDECLIRLSLDKQEDIRKKASKMLTSN